MSRNMAARAGKKAPPLAKHDSSVLDLAFAMDCTGSMGSYIDSARNNVRSIVEAIVAAEKSDVRLALVEYRDHPPQDSTFVTRLHNFTGSVSTMRRWLDACSAQGGGDAPEAVADALHDVLKLSWREEACKICVLIADAPPHGLCASGDSFPNGCPAGLDPMSLVREMAAKGITLYVVGCEPSLAPHKAFFTALAHLTGGQYVPLTSARALTQVIIGSAQEEMSLEQLMADVNAEVLAEARARGQDNLDRDQLARRVWGKLKKKGARCRQIQKKGARLKAPSASAIRYSAVTSMDALRAVYKPEAVSGFGMRSPRPSRSVASGPTSRKRGAAPRARKSARKSASAPRSRLSAPAVRSRERSASASKSRKSASSKRPCKSATSSKSRKSASAAKSSRSSSTKPPCKSTPASRSRKGTSVSRSPEEASDPHTRKGSSAARSRKRKHASASEEVDDGAFETADVEVDFMQAKRMVMKSIARNFKSV